MLNLFTKPSIVPIEHEYAHGSTPPHLLRKKLAIRFGPTQQLKRIMDGEHGRECRHHEPEDKLCRLEHKPRVHKGVRDQGPKVVRARRARERHNHAEALQCVELELGKAQPRCCMAKGFSESLKIFAQSLKNELGCKWSFT
jgi:hypothetical protein